MGGAVFTSCDWSGASNGRSARWADHGTGGPAAACQDCGTLGAGGICWRLWLRERGRSWEDVAGRCCSMALPVACLTSRVRLLAMAAWTGLRVWPSRWGWSAALASAGMTPEGVVA